MPRCSGPCLPHCFQGCPPLPTLAARAGVAYALASAGYLVWTRGMGTPFADSLTPEQRALQAASASARARVFAGALVLATLVVARWNP